jgi:hypothetical protein
VNIQALPKAGLYCHLDSVLSPEMALAIRRIEIHAGEWCRPELVWSALEHGYDENYAC